MSIKEMTMPQLGESVVEGTISQWLVSSGDNIEQYQPIAEVMTDKVNTEIPSSYSGTITKLHVAEGETVAVGALLCSVATEENNSHPTRGEKAETKNESSQAQGLDQSMKNRYSPAVLKLAQENDIDLVKVNGTGKSGRITRKDIELIIKQEETKSVQLAPKTVEKKEQKPLDALTIDEEIPVTGIRKAIANNMVRSTTEIPHAWMMIEVDVTNLVNYRNAEKDNFKQKEGYNLSYFAFFLNAVAKALKKFPELNSSWAGDKIIRHKDINLSIAVGNDKELFVPVIKNVDEKSIKGIAKELHLLVNKAKSGSLTQQDMKGGTFTVNNTGTFGSVQSMGVINYPQAAILQVESIVKRPVIINNMFAARDMVNLCLSLDHRILDGVICGQFMSHVKEILEGISGDTTPIY